MKKQLQFYVHWKLEVWNQKNEPSFNFQYFDPQFARTGLYIYVHIVPIGYIYVVIVLHKKDNWANKSCIYAYFNLHSYSYAKICLWLPIVYMCITYSFFLLDPVIIKGSSSYFIRLVRSRSRFIYAQNRDVSSMCGLLLKFGW